MAYRPPTKSVYASAPAATPAPRPTFLEPDDGEGKWQLSALRRKKPEPVTSVAPPKPKTAETLCQEDFPSLGGKPAVVKSTVHKSSSTESMAERMKKKLKEEEEERLRKEEEKRLEEEEQEKNRIDSMLTGAFVRNTRLMRHFEQDRYDASYEYHEDSDTYRNDIDYDGYGYRPATPTFPLHHSSDEKYPDEYENDNDYDNHY